MKNKEEERKALQNMILESIRLGYTPHLLLNNTMNKLLEILDEFDNLTLGYCNDDELDEVSYLAGQAHFKEYYKKFLKEKLVEYARSKVPEKTQDYIKESPVAWLGYESCRINIRDSIDQDLQSLNN